MGGGDMSELPAPRLQLRWTTLEENPQSWRRWCCVYELVMPLREGDIRSGIHDGDGERIGTRTEYALEIGKTNCGGEKEPCRKDDGTLYADAPWRDSCHALHEAGLLGGLPIYVIAVDGTPMLWAKQEMKVLGCGG